MPLYDFDTKYLGQKLMPPGLRKVKHNSWISVLLKPIQTLWGLIFNDYADGSNYPLFDDPTTYTAGSKVINFDKKIYMALKTTVGHFTDDTNYWVLVNDNFMGARERVTLNSQKIVLEYALNKWFLLNTAPFIYINNNVVAGNAFLLGETSDTSSTMANQSLHQKFYLGQAFVLNQYDFTIYVPTLLFVTLGTTPLNRENAVRQFADQYVLAGIKYNVLPY